MAKSKSMFSSLEDKRNAGLAALVIAGIGAISSIVAAAIATSNKNKKKKELKLSKKA